jgi:hypothetical protein
MVSGPPKKRRQWFEKDMAVFHCYFDSPGETDAFSPKAGFVHTAIFILSNLFGI